MGTLGTTMDDLPAAEQLLASAVRFLVDGGEEDTASLLLACSIDVQHGREWMDLDRLVREVDISLAGPRAAYDALRLEPSVFADQPHRTQTENAFRAVLPPPYALAHLEVRAEIMNINPGWRTELLEIARGRGSHNQVAANAVARTWCSLRFRSQSEIRIAQALDRAGVLFLPNCLSRLTTTTGRQTREADFLVCKDGKWGILEVDGEPFHPPTRTVQDHERDRLFRDHGIRVVEHFDADVCYNTPDKVTARFLALLDRAG